MARVKVDVELRKTAFDAGLKEVQHSFQELKGFIAAALSAEAIKTMIEKTMEYAYMIDKASLRMKLTTEETQALGIVAKEAGSSLEKVEAAFKKIEIARAKALGGNAQAIAAFAALGVQMADLKKRNNIIELGGKVSSAAANGTNDVQGVALAGLGLKGTAGDLIEIGDALKNFAEKVEELKKIGAIMSDKDIANLVEAKDRMELLGTQFKASLAGPISSVLEAIYLWIMMAQSYFEHLFAAIGLMASKTFEFVMDLARNVGGGAVNGAIEGGKQNGIIGAVTGAVSGAIEGGKDIPELTKNYIEGIGADVFETGKEFFDDLADKYEEYQNAMAARQMLRDKLRTNNVEGELPEVKTAKNQRLYSDSLTANANFMGAAFRNAGTVASSLDLQKQQLTTSNKQLSEQQKQTDLLKALAEQKENTSNDFWDSF